VQLRPESLRDTIVARATPPGEGAIAVVRLSGPEARRIGAALGGGRRGISHQLELCRLSSAGRLLDLALVVEMHAPHSFTGEDVVELQVHGSRAVVEVVLAECLRLGARLAAPGEFSLRAFLNGRMDLSQAEALADLIAARSELQRQIAADQLAGSLSDRVASLLEGLEQILAQWMVLLDYPDHAQDDVPWKEHREALESIACKIQTIIDSARLELSRGFKVVLCGAPNVGKSTLLNALAGRERVLVDAEPGTTRDPVEVELTDAGTRWTVCDTAGIRQSASGLEARGMALSREWMQGADLSLWLVTADERAWPEPSSTVRVVGSKADQVGVELRSAVAKEAQQRGLPFIGWVSGVTGEGLDQLRRKLVERTVAPVREGETVLVRLRHLEAFQRCQAAIREVLSSPELTLDVRCQTLEAAARALGNVLGRDVDASILKKVFSEFCIGK
jgi:tRNA modification GTPase